MADTRKGARPDALTVQVGLELRTRLRDFAIRDHRDQSHHVRVALEEYLDRVDPKPAPAQSAS